jgi:ribonuclease-3
MLKSRACNRTLNARGQQWSLDQFVNKNPLQNGGVSETIRANTVEAIIGAVWLDSGRNAAQVDLVMEKMGLYAD